VNGGADDLGGVDLDSARLSELRWIRRLLAALVSIVTIYIAVIGASVFIPIFLATLLSLVLAPVVRMLTRWRVPRSLAAALVIVTVIASTGALIASLISPARDWIARVPKTLDRLGQAAHELLRRPLQAATQATQAWSDLTNTHSGAQPVRVVDAPGPGALWQVISVAPGILISTIATLLLTYIFLRHADTVLLKSVQLAPQWRLKREIVGDQHIPVFGYFSGPAAKITTSVHGQTVAANLATWTEDPSVVFFWFDPDLVADSASLTPLIAYDANGKRLTK